MNSEVFKVSVVTVCYNAVETIEETILSVINQTYPFIEYIVIDGASTDGTVEVAHKYQDKITCLVSEPDTGIYDAMNKGIRLATGKLINFMNAGDRFADENVIKEVVSRANSNSDVIFGNVLIEYKEGIVCLQKAQPFYEHLPLHHMAGFNHQATFVSVDLAKQLEFDTKYKLAADYNMIISLYMMKATFQQLDVIVAIYKYGGISQQRIKYHIKETLEIDGTDKKVLYIKANLIYLRSFVNSIIKKLLFCISPLLAVRILEK